MKKTLFAAAILSIFLASCDAMYSYEYQVSNLCDTTISVVIKRGTDSTIYIPAHITQTVYFTTHMDKPKRASFRGIHTEGIDTIYAKRGSRVSTKNILKTDNWTFTQSSGALTNTKTTISDADF